jgi:hypothetical protein
MNQRKNILLHHKHRQIHAQMDKILGYDDFITTYILHSHTRSPGPP